MTKRRTVISVSFLLFLFLLCLSWPINSWFKAFIKIDQIRMFYLVSFFVLLCIAVLLLQRYLFKASTLILVFLGAITGHIAASISIPIANFFDPHSFEGTVRTIREFGIMKVILFYLSVSLVLGGWLFGIVSFTLMRFLEGCLSREKAFHWKRRKGRP